MVVALLSSEGSLGLVESTSFCLPRALADIFVCVGSSGSIVGLYVSDGLRFPPSRSKFAGTCLGTYVCCSFLGPKYGTSEGRRAEYLRGCSFRG